MVSLVLSTFLTAGGTAVSQCGCAVGCGVEQYPPVPKMTRFANLIAPFVFCANVRSAVPPGPWSCGCVGSACAGYGGCGCYSCGCMPLPNWYVSPYSVGGCAIPGWQGFYECGGVLVAQVYGPPGVYWGLMGPPVGGHAPVPAGLPLGAPIQPQRQMPKAPETGTETTATAQVTIKAAPQARVRVNGQLLERSAAEMTFATPELQAGQVYTYVFTAEIERDGKTVVETRRVEIRAGAVVVVDFTEIKGSGGPPGLEMSRVALLTLNVPGDAKLFVDGQPVVLPNGQRTFTTPALQSGKKQFYELKAEVVRNGVAQTETRKVYVEPGQRLQVDFKRLLEMRTASR